MPRLPSPQQSLALFQSLPPLVKLRQLRSRPPLLPKRSSKRGKTLVISESEVRRISRLHELNKGFKPSTCKDKNCVGCATKPPLISSSVIRELGTTFCKISPSELTEQQLMAKPAKKRIVGRPKKNKDYASNQSPEGASEPGKGE